MITPNEVISKATKKYNSVLSSIYTGTDCFPLSISGDKGAKLPLLERVSGLRKLINGAKDTVGYGYDLTIESRDTRREGRQTFVTNIVIPDLTNFLKLIDRESEYYKFKSYTSQLLIYGDELKELIIKKPSLFVKNISILGDIIKVIDYFYTHPKPGLYLRELPIDVHTKFIEQNKSFITTLLDIVLPSKFINSEETTFEKRYGLRLDQNFYVHIRFPDNSFYNGLKEVAIPLEEINKTNIHFKNIYIVENRMNYLTLLLNSGDIVIWGMGKGLSLFRDINFLQDVNIYYWGDIDPQGFEILNNLRSYYPNVVSILMDNKTFDDYNEYAHGISLVKQLDLPYLTKEERELYKRLFKNNECLRLEQERIRFSLGGN